MYRRQFMMAGMGTLAAGAPIRSHAQSDRRREYYELRRFSFASVETRDRFARYLDKAFAPAAGRVGAKPVGLFAPIDDPNQQPVLDLYVLIVYGRLDTFASMGATMAADETYRADSAFVLDLPPSDPAFVHQESGLLAAFSGWPKIKIPKETAGNQPRVFELRIYESHSKKANRKKIEMFNRGEIGVFERAGFQPVFFGETLIGPQVPNLTYMVTYPSAEKRGEYWQRFGADPEKTRLFAIPEYADKLIVSKIRTVMLRPIDGSQI